MSEIGELSVRVRPDTRGFSKKAKREIERQLRGDRDAPEVRLKPTIDPKEAKRELSRTARLLSADPDVDKVKLFVEFDFKSAYQRLNHLVRLLNRIAKRDETLMVHLQAEIDIDGDHFMRNLEYLQRSVNETPLTIPTQTGDNDLIDGDSSDASDAVDNRIREYEREATFWEWAQERMRKAHTSALNKITDATAEYADARWRRHYKAFFEPPKQKWRYVGNEGVPYNLTVEPRERNVGEKAALAFQRGFNRKMRYFWADIADLAEGRLALRFRNIFSGVDFRAIGREAGTKSAIGFGDGLRRLSGMRIAGDFARDVWEPLANFDRHLPKLITTSSLLTTIAGGVGSIVTDIFSVANDLGRIIPGLLALPGILVSGGIAIASIVVGLKGMGKYAPEIGKAYKGFGDSMQKEFWKAKEAISDSLIGLEPTLRKGMSQVSGAAGKLVGSFLSDFNKIVGPHMGSMFDAASKGVETFSTHMDSAAKAIRDLGRIGSRYFPQLAAWGGKVLDSFSGWLENAVNSGKAFQWVDTAVSRLKSLASVVKNTVGLIGDIGRIAERAGGASLESLASGLKKVRDGLRDGSKGAQNLEKFMRAAKDTFGGFLSTVGPGLGKFIDMLAGIAEEVGPKLSKAVGGTLGALLEGFSSPAFARATRTFATEVGKLADIIKPVVKQSSELVGIFDTLNAAIVPFGRLGAAAVGGVLTAIDDLGPSLVKVVDTLGNSAADIGVTVFAPLTKTVSDLGPLLESVASAIETVISGNLPELANVMGTVDSVVSSLSGALQRLLPGLASGLSSALSGVLRFADGLLKIIRFAGTGFAESLGAIASVLGTVVSAIGSFVGLLGDLASALVGANGALGGFGAALGHIAGTAVALLAARKGLGKFVSLVPAAARKMGALGGTAAAASASLVAVGAAGKAATKGAAGVSKSMQGAAQQAGMLAVATDGVDKKSGKAGRSLKSMGGSAVSGAKQVGKFAAQVAAVDLAFSSAGWGEGAVRSVDEVTSTFRDAASGAGDLNDAFRSIDGRALADNFFGLSPAIYDVDSAFRELESGMGWLSQTDEVAAEAFEAIDRSLQGLDFAAASDHFKMFSNEVLNTGRSMDTAVNQVDGYRDSVKQMLREAGFEEYANDSKVLAGVMRGELPAGLGMSAEGLYDVKEAARAAKRELRMDEAIASMEVGLAQLPDMARRSTSQMTQEIQAAIQGLGSVVTTAMPDIKEYWTQLGGGGQSGAKLAKDNLKIVQTAFSDATTVMEKAGIDATKYGGDISKAMDDAFKNGGTQAEAAKKAMEIVSTAFEQTGIDAASLEKAISEMDLAPDTEAALREVLGFYESLPGHARKGMGDAARAANDEFRSIWAKNLDMAISTGDRIGQEAASWNLQLVEAADRAGISIDEVRAKMEHPLELFRGQNLADPAIQSLLTLLDTEGTVRAALESEAKLYNGIDPTRSVSDQMLELQRKAGEARAEMEKPLKAMNDPTEAPRAGTEDLTGLLDECKIGTERLAELSPIQDKLSNFREGVKQTQTPLDDLSSKVSLFPSVIPGVPALVSGFQNLGTGASAGADGVQRMQDTLRPGLPSTGVDDANIMRDAFGKLKDRSLDMANGVVTNAQNMASGVSGGLANMRGAVDSSTSGMSSIMSSRMAAMATIVSTRAAAMATAMTTRFAAMSTAATARMGAMQAQVAAKVAAMATAVAAHTVRMSAAIMLMSTVAARAASLLGSAMTRVSTSAARAAAGVTVASARASAAMMQMGAAAGRMAGAVAAGMGRAVGSARAAAGAIRGAFGGAGGWLVGAGRAIMAGLASGIASGIGRIRAMLQGVTAMIPRWKGPADTDAKLLVNAGQLIMGGLTTSMWDAFQSETKPMLQRITKEIGSTQMVAPGAHLTAPSFSSVQDDMLTGATAGAGKVVNNEVNINYPHPETTPAAVQRASQMLTVMS